MLNFRGLALNLIKLNTGGRSLIAAGVENVKKKSFRQLDSTQPRGFLHFNYVLMRVKHRPGPALLTFDVIVALFYHNMKPQLREFSDNN
jgi:hypothetical protein